MRSRDAREAELVFNPARAKLANPTGTLADHAFATHAFILALNGFELHPLNKSIKIVFCLNARARPLHELGGHPGNGCSSEIDQLRSAAQPVD